MSVVAAMDALFDEKDNKIQDEIIEFYNSKITEFKDSDWGEGTGYVDMIIDYTRKDGYLNISFKGRDDCDFFTFCLNEFNNRFDCNYYAPCYLEGDGIYIKVRHNEIVKNNIKFSPGRYKKRFWEILESDNYLEDIKAWTIEKISK